MSDDATDEFDGRRPGESDWDLGLRALRFELAKAQARVKAGEPRPGDVSWVGLAASMAAQEDTKRQPFPVDQSP